MKNEERAVQTKQFLQCEKKWVYHLLIFIGGYLGAYTMILRGGVFCNAQTGNFVLFGIALGEGRFNQASYYLIPIFAYFAGSIIAEVAQPRFRMLGVMRWETALVGFQAVATLLLGFLPDSTPVQLTQITVNFLCAMQYNTFRQSEGMPMATTFCTNHLRQLSNFLVKGLQKKDQASLLKSFAHMTMLCTFVLGVSISAFLCHRLQGYTIWGASALYFLLFIAFLKADLTKEKALLDQSPSGH